MQNRARDIVYAHTPCPEDGNSTLKHRLSTKNCKGCKQIVSAVESCLGELWCDTNRDSECFGIVPASLGSSCVLCSQLRDLALKLSWDALYLKVCIMRTAEDCVESHLRIGPDLSDDSGLVFFFEKMLDILPKETHESCITAPGHHSALIYRPSLYLADFQFMNAWLKSCHSAHGTCRNYQATYRPKFLIHCGRREVCQDSKAPYACLSYVWGVPSSTDTSYEPVLALPTLPPRTVADAMTVALHLGLEYLWVDRYCIEQDNHAEKINAIGNMDAICKFCLPSFHK